MEERQRGRSRGRQTREADRRSERRQRRRAGRDQEYREEQRLQNRQKKKRKRIWTIAIQLVVLVFILVCAIYAIYDRQMDSKTMGCKISVYGKDVSWLTVEEAAAEIMDSFEKTNVDFVENGKNVYSVTLAEAGYTLDEAELQKELELLKENRKPCLIFFEKQKEHQIEFQVIRKEDQERTAFSVAHFGETREDSVDACIRYDESTGQYEIISDELGTWIDEEKLFSKAGETISQSIENNLLTGEIEIPVDDEVYVEPEIKQDNQELEEKKADLNRRLTNYPKSVVTYTFGSVTEVLDSDTIRSWMQIGEDELTLDEEAIRQYITDLGYQYNTMYVPRSFTTSYGETVEISNNEYGYWIDEGGEYQKLLEDLLDGTPVTREPVYSHTGLRREGSDDLMGSYVEADLDQQYLWLYVDGGLITSTPIISGKPEGINSKTGEKEDWSTYRGAYPLAYKESPSTLSSDIYGYEVEVQYWMPFVYGQGLHDASWHGTFGGELYKTVGSHGCINLPTDQAALIYSYVEKGFPVIIY